MGCRVVLVLTTRVKFKHLVDNPRDTVAVFLHHFTDFLHLLVTEGNVRIGQHLREALEGIEGRANLVENFFNKL